MQLQSGTLLQGGKYRIERVLGQGGFGITYQAVQVALNRKVAIKEFFMKEYCERNETTSQVSLGTSGSRETVERFRQKFIKEAQNIAALNHPYIIRIHDIFEENGTAYYVMEYCDKGSLGDLVKRQGALDEAEALRYIRQVADALGYIHERKMNHLDVKPGNILLDENMNAVLIDFGLSKRYDEEGNQTSTTPVGISRGYAPLEQYKKGGVGTFSPATDIYSLGATLYKLLTGQTPPEANDVMDDGLPALPSSVSSATVSAIEKAMQSSRKNRPQSVKELLGMLDEVPVFNGLEDTIPVDEVLETDKEWNICGTEPLPVGFQLRSGSFVYEIVECLSKDACSYVYKAIRKGQEDENVILLENMPNEFMGGRVGDSSGEYEIDFSISDYDEWRGLFQEKVKILSKSCKVLERFNVGYATALVSFSAPIKKELLDACMMKKKVNESYGESVPAPSPVSPSSSWKKWAVPLAAGLVATLAVLLWPKGGQDEKREDKVEAVVQQAVAQQQEPVKPVQESQPVKAEPEKPAVVKEEAPAPSLLYVTTSPSGATVYVDGKKVGTSPLEGKEVTQGRHTVKISKSGYESISEKKDFGEKPVEFNKTLVKLKTNTPGVAVDLGLSVKWADRNVGADSPSDYGCYFAWGETSTKSDYTESNSVTYEKSFSDISGNRQYDAARANWGGSWRLPTKSECEELNTKCTWTWTTQGGHNGYKVTGPNGNSIFLPAAGYRYGSSLGNAEEYGNYCSSMPREGGAQCAYSLFFGGGSRLVDWGYRYYGRTVRPVTE